MAFQTVFKRYELKYLLTAEQKRIILRAMEPYMQLDKYGRTTIRNLYYDTDDYRLIRYSIEKPVYKEKLRVRSYCQTTHEGTVFVELKKKYEKVVYKRRIALTEREAISWLSGESSCPQSTQISREIDYFTDFYGRMSPTVFISYEREAYYERNGGNFRVTFDENILCRRDDLALTSPAYGDPILSEGRTVMELKCSGGIPIWMAKVLSEEHIYKTSFSKYGTAYESLIFPKLFLTEKRETKELIIHGNNF